MLPVSFEVLRSQSIALINRLLAAPDVAPPHPLFVKLANYFSALHRAAARRSEIEWDHELTRAAYNYEAWCLDRDLAIRVSTLDQVKHLPIFAAFTDRFQSMLELLCSLHEDMIFASLRRGRPWMTNGEFGRLFSDVEVLDGPLSAMDEFTSSTDEDTFNNEWGVER